jgi:hypothetical protein
MACLKCGDSCRYITLLIPTGTGDQCWLLLHEGVEIIPREDGDLVKVSAVCKELQADNTCAIYADRPDTCRRYRCAKNILDDIKEM